MIGSTKLPSAAGTDGMITRNTMIAPWSVNIWLYASWLSICWPGAISSVRTAERRDAAEEERQVSTATMYMTPMRL